jgi:multidrug resistance efflux pump
MSRVDTDTDPAAELQSLLAADAEIEAAEEAVTEAKEALKEAKSALSSAVARRRSLARTARERFPLFDGE